MNRISILVAAVIICITGCSENNTKRPNVVIIYSDDVGYGDLGVYGAEMIPTPNLDQMAAEGLLFTDAHCMAATCTPSRYSLLTGEFCFRNKGAHILSGSANMIIGEDQYTLGEVFREAGYKTAIVGKWHLGLGTGTINWNEKISPNPYEAGFDYSFLIPATNDRTPCVYVENGNVVNLDPNDPLTVSNRKRIPKEVPGTDYPDA